MLVGLLETSVVVAQQLIKSTTSVWIGMGPGAGRVEARSFRPYAQNFLGRSGCVNAHFLIA